MYQLLDKHWSLGRTAAQSVDKVLWHLQTVNTYYGQENKTSEGANYSTGNVKDAM